LGDTLPVLRPKGHLLAHSEITGLDAGVYNKRTILLHMLKGYLSKMFYSVGPL